MTHPVPGARQRRVVDMTSVPSFGAGLLEARVLHAKWPRSVLPREQASMGWGVGAAALGTGMGGGWTHAVVVARRRRSAPLLLACESE